MIRLIVAVDPNGVIGVDGTMPWHYKADFKRFKERTMAGVLLMGRKTFESLPIPKAGPVLPGRDIIVVSRNPDGVDPEQKTRRIGYSAMPGDGAVISTTVEGAVEVAKDPHLYGGRAIWVAGGAELYNVVLKQNLVDEIDYTLVPEVPAEKLSGNVVRFPKDLLSGFELVEETVNAEDARLTHRIYRCTSQPSS